MANALKGEADFDHEGETRTVRFDVEAFLRFEDATGIGLFEVDQALAKLGMTAELLRAGLGEAGEGLSRKAASEILLTNATARVAVVTALNRALPSGEGDGAGPPKAARKPRGDGTGKKS